MSLPGAHELERSAVVVCTRGAVDRIAGMLGQIDDGQLPVFFFLLRGEAGSIGPRDGTELSLLYS